MKDRDRSIRQDHHERNRRGFTPLDRRRHLTGFTLIEVMVSMLIFATSMTAAFTLYTTISRLDDSNRNLTQALNDGRIVMEAIRNTAQANGLAAVTATNWTAWAAVPANGVVNPATHQPWLPNEVIRVFYSTAPAAFPAVPGPAPVPLPDPLGITVRVEWQEENRAGDVNRQRWINVANTWMTVR